MYFDLSPGTVEKEITSWYVKTFVGGHCIFWAKLLRKQWGSHPCTSFSMETLA